jgi:hypothetical protein
MSHIVLSSDNIIRTNSNPAALFKACTVKQQSLIVLFARTRATCFKSGIVPRICRMPGAGKCMARPAYSSPGEAAIYRFGIVRDSA